MEKRRLLVGCLAVSASLWAFTAARAQTGDVSAVASECGVTVLTNLSQLVVAIDNPGLTYPQIFPYDAAFDPWDTWFADFSQLPEGLAAIQNYPGQEQNGVVFFPLRVIQYADTGETVLQYPYFGVELLWLPSLPNYQPFQPYNEKLSSYCQQTGRNPTDYEALISSGEWFLDPPRICMDLWVAPLACCAAFESNLEAQAEADAAAATTAQPSGNSTLRAMGVGGGMFMAMDDDDDGGDGDGDPPAPDGTGIDPVPSADDPPFSLLQAFAVTTVQPTGKGVRITFQSSQWSHYLIWYANDLTSNTVWIPQAYVWGTTNSGLTSYIDTTSTNLNHRFYRVQRLVGQPVAAGAEHSVAITQDGRLWAWGRSDGNLGDGLDSGIYVYNRAIPQNEYVEQFLPYPNDVANVTTCGIQAITNAVAVAAGGDDFTLVVDASGTVWSFGENTEGQLGQGLDGIDLSNESPDTNLYPVPLQVSALSNVVGVAAGYQHALALCATGTVFAWGDNSAGQLGLGNLAPDVTNSPAQLQFPAGTIIVAVAAGNGFSLALDATGGVRGWGENGSGQIAGAATSSGTNLPMVIPGLPTVIAIAAGDSHSMALTADKTVWTWGYSAYGALGRSGDYATPGQVANLTNVVAIAAGRNFSAAVDAGGKVYAWGDNSQAELATSSTDVPYTNSPIPVAGISTAVLICAPVGGDGANPFGFSSGDPGGRHVLAMTLDGGTNHYVSWGDSDDGQTGTGLSGYGTNGQPTNTNGNAASQYVPTQLQFCTRCQREVQLGTGGVFTAQCNGMLYLYFNGEIGQFNNYSGSYTVTVNSVTTNVPAFDNTGYGIGIAAGTVTVGNVYTYTASGFCEYNTILEYQSDADGTDSTTSNLVDCSSAPANNYLNKTNTICPWLRCFSLVGKIQ